MIVDHSNKVRYRAVLERNSEFDGIFYFAKMTGIYCLPSCHSPHPLKNVYTFFTTEQEAVAQGYRACKRCIPSTDDSQLSIDVLDNINAGVISDEGVHGLAQALHISERHLRRIVQKRTGSSPLRLNQEKRLAKAMLLVTCTGLPIIEVAFNAGFSSLRQFNSVFKYAFKLTPREMRKTAAYAPNKGVLSPITPPSKSSYARLLV